jgi:hypothetical protein
VNKEYLIRKSKADDEEECRTEKKEFFIVAFH